MPAFRIEVTHTVVETHIIEAESIEEAMTAFDGHEPETEAVTDTRVSIAEQVED